MRIVLVIYVGILTLVPFLIVYAFFASFVFSFLATVVIAAPVFTFFCVRRMRAGQSNKEDLATISLVGLYRKTPFLDRYILENSAAHAWGVGFEAGDDAMTFIAGESPRFVLRTEKRTYAIVHCDRPYCESVEELAEMTIENRAKHILQHHSSWISIVLLGPRDESLDVDEEYSRIGKLLNQLVNEDTMAIVIPELMRLVPWDDSLAPKLAGNHPLADLSPTNPPVFNIADDDPQMIVAVEQARSRWPQFVTAFENHARSEESDLFDDQFSVKAPVSVDGITEFIWLTVTAIENQIIYGLLCNYPVSLHGLSKGDRVRVPVERINDWIYSQNGRKSGGFTVKILHDLANQKLRSA